MLVGRETEIEILKQALESTEAELIAIYGRRRVGKTFLVRHVYADRLLFDFSGMHHSTMREQLENFSHTLISISKIKIPLAVPLNWIQAFEILKTYITPLLKKKKYVLFFDEFPWIDSRKSGFLSAFEHFWNSWASRQNNLVVVICGSAASWMIRKIINHRGGLHNRITRKIRLLPFTLNETEAYLQSRRVNLDRYQLLQVYMALGGIPHYLKNVNPGESATQLIDRLCFTKDGMLENEFENLYGSLFEQAEKHVAVVRALSKKPSGLTRREIIEANKLTSGGAITKLLEELAESGFIMSYIPFDKTSKESIYKLSDEFSRFYLKFMEGSKASGQGTWIRQSATASWKSWSGSAFESICLKHTAQIKKALGISGVYTEQSAWRYGGSRDEHGSQIDLVIDRQDFCINICEMKFSVADFVIDKNYASDLRRKLNVFGEKSKTKKTLFLTMVTTFGVRQNEQKLSLVQNEVQMDALFEKL